MTASIHSKKMLSRPVNLLPKIRHIRAVSTSWGSQPSTFIQDQPRHENAFTSDAFLMRCLQRLIPTEALVMINKDLSRFGDRVRRDIWRLGQQCEAQPPYLKASSPWGHRDMELKTSEAWQAQKNIAAEEGLVAIAYEKEYGQYSR